MEVWILDNKGHRLEMCDRECCNNLNLLPRLVTATVQCVTTVTGCDAVRPPLEQEENFKLIELVQCSGVERGSVEHFSESRSLPGCA